MPATQDTWTVAMLDALPDDGQRYELIDGVVHVTPAPSFDHQCVVGEFFAVLREYVRTSGLARALMSPSDVRRRDRARNRVQPDVFVVRVVDGKRPEYPFDMADILLVIEVQSPGNPLYDYQVKRELYLRNGVPEYWIANPEARMVSRWRSVDDPGEVFSGRIQWQLAGLPAPLEIDVQQLFDEALAG